MIEAAIEKIAGGCHLTEQEAQGAMRDIMQGTASPAQIAAFLMGLQLLGETVEEITGCAIALREAMTPISCQAPIIVDTCGTGGDGAETFNISTAAAFIVAGAQYTVAKHGNRSISSRCGSADVLEALGVSLQASPVVVARCLKDIGIGFLFAPLLHGAMRHAMPVRKELRIRTVFNLLGPLVNPARANVQLVGVAQEQLVEPIARVCQRLGLLRVMVVHGRIKNHKGVAVQGLDEVSLSGDTVVAEVGNGTIQLGQLTPEMFGLRRVAPEALRGGTKEENAATLRDLLAGRRGPYRDAALLNAACAILMAARAEQRKDITDYQIAFQAATEALDSGKALAKLEALIKLSHESL
ncbi:MAG: anthranilate phosphoribosyltransferase [Elusimicrobia bacterium]|nr:anthranilate phosphoribosyltransferase [Elusimicrobiota bacterium]